LKDTGIYVWAFLLYKYWGLSAVTDIEFYSGGASADAVLIIDVLAIAAIGIQCLADGNDNRTRMRL
jgi:hypothetical protein